MHARIMPEAVSVQKGCSSALVFAWLVILFLLFRLARWICFRNRLEKTVAVFADYLIISQGFDFEVPSCVHTLRTKRLLNLSITAWMLHKFCRDLSTGYNIVAKQLAYIRNDPIWIDMCILYIDMILKYHIYIYTVYSIYTCIMHIRYGHDCRSCKHVRRLRDWQKDGWYFSTDGRGAAVIQVGFQRVQTNTLPSDNLSLLLNMDMYREFSG